MILIKKPRHLHTSKYVFIHFPYLNDNWLVFVWNNLYALFNELSACLNGQPMVGFYNQF